MHWRHPLEVVAPLHTHGKGFTVVVKIFRAQYWVVVRCGDDAPPARHLFISGTSIEVVALLKFGLRLYSFMDIFLNFEDFTKNKRCKFLLIESALRTFLD